jgi:hypothetical protein
LIAPATTKTRRAKAFGFFAFWVLSTRICAFKKDQIMTNTTVVESRNERSETKALRCNLRAVLLLRAGQRFMLIAPILVPFFALMILLMEIPSGYFADRYGRGAVLRAGGLLQLVGALAGQGAHAVERLLGSRHAIDAIGLVALAGLLLLGAAMLSWVMVGGVLLFAVRGLFSVCFMDALNRRIDNDYRATINSLLGFGFRLGFIVTA